MLTKVVTLAKKLISIDSTKEIPQNLIEVLKISKKELKILMQNK